MATSIILTKLTLSVIEREGLISELNMRAPALIIGLCGLSVIGKCKCTQNMKQFLTGQRNTIDRKEKGNGRHVIMRLKSVTRNLLIFVCLII